MATSSITKNFVIEGKEQVEMFADAIEASAHDKPLEINVSSKTLTDRTEIEDFMRAWRAQILIGYFTIALKPLTVRADTVSGTVRRTLQTVLPIKSPVSVYSLILTRALSPSV